MQKHIHIERARTRGTELRIEVVEGKEEEGGERI
jgi:hypothetical protein